MSQELVGNCGAVVGSADYFQRINQGTIVAPFMMLSSGYQYYYAVEQLCSRCVSVLDEIYSDLQSAGPALAELSPEKKENLHQLVSNLDAAANFISPAFTSANSCRAILDRDSSSETIGIAGIWGSDVGSVSYMQSKCSSIFQSIFADPLASIVQTITSDLTGIANQISADIDQGVSQHHYMTDENGNVIQNAIRELERCSVSVFHSQSVGQLCWYREISTDKVLGLQKALNNISGFGTLTEDGIYGEKTSNAWRDFMDNLAHGAFPSLTYIDPLQTTKTGVGVASRVTKNGETFSRIIDSASGIPLFRADRHPFGKNRDYFHVNVDALKDAPSWQKGFAKATDHMQISEGAYSLLKNFDDTAKVVRIGGRILLVAGIAMDVLELGSVISDDLSDADQKLGKATASATTSIIGSWSGGMLGAKAGAALGAGIGTAILPGLGTAIGGIAGGLILGIAGSAAGSKLGEWIVDITDVWE